MTILLTPELGVPIPPQVLHIDLAERAEAACDTANLLTEHGLVLSFDDVDAQIATTLAKSYAKDPEKTSHAVSNNRTAHLTPASLVQVSELLKEFGQLVAHEAAEIRNLVTNKLLIETANPDPKVRLKALELLGKMSSVDLFTDRKEVTITHESPSALNSKLRQKLERLRTLKQNASGEYEEVVLDNGLVDVDKELGFFEQPSIQEIMSGETLGEAIE